MRSKHPVLTMDRTEVAAPTLSAKDRLNFPPVSISTSAAPMFQRLRDCAYEQYKLPCPVHDGSIQTRFRLVCLLQIPAISFERFRGTAASSVMPRQRLSLGT